MALDVAALAPEHVPASLIWDHDYFAFADDAKDPFRRVGELHAGPDILWATRVGGGMGGQHSGWLPTRNAMIREVLTDATRFRSGASSIMSAIGLDWKLIPLEIDPPYQQLYRRVLEPFFSPAGVNALDGAVHEACDRLVEDFQAKNACEFAGDFAEKFPSYIFLDLMGMPRERLADFLAWERGMIRPRNTEELVASMTSVLDYLKEFIESQRAKPNSDLMKSLFSARYNNERPLTDTEILSTCYLLYIGGLDTVYSTLGWIFWHLADDPALQNRLRANPAEAARATEELLRAFSVASMSRQVIEDMEFHGVSMKAGDFVHLSLPLAARDPQVYEDPHRIDIDRQVRHIAFGTGAHTCLGLRLAKREIRIVLEVLLTRFRNLHVPRGEKFLFHTGSVFGIDRLPLEWEAA